MSIYSSHKPPVGEGGGLYLKLQDGETVKLRFASQPAIFEAEGKDRETGEITLRTQYGWLVWNQDQKMPQVWTQGVRFFKQIAALAQDEEWGDPIEYDIKLTRQGSDTSTTYTVTPSSNRTPLGDEAKEKINKIDLIKAIGAGRGNQRVMWLSEWDDQVAQQEEQGHEKEVDALETAGKAKKAADKDAVIEDIGDEPMNLDDIPF
jgi:hypothetical protein